MSTLAASVCARFWALACTVTVVLGLAACDNNGDADTVDSVSGSKAEKTTDEQAKQQPTKSADTGTSAFQHEADSIRRDLERIEQEKRPEEPAAIELQQREIKMVLKNVEHHLTAIEVSIRAESRRIVMSRFKEFKTKQGKMLAHLDTLWREVSEIRELLRNAAKGTSEIPRDFTEDELKDRAADIEEKMQQVKKEEQDLVVRLDALQAQLREKIVPEQGETTLTKERDVLQALRTRGQKLLDPS
jgi:hypothetical protein